MNQLEFGELFGLSRDQIKRLENGQMEASVSLAVKMQDVSGIPVYQLYHEALLVEEIPSHPGGVPDLVREPQGDVRYGTKTEEIDLSDLVKLIAELKEIIVSQGERISQLEQERGLDDKKPF